MSKKSIIEREKNRLYFRNRYGTLRNFLRGKIKNSSSFAEKFFYQSCLQALPRDSSILKNHNRCFITGRPRGYYRFFGLSRHVLREFSQKGFLPGVTKSSW